VSQKEGLSELHDFGPLDRDSLERLELVVSK
jgi:hypothetical protein